MAEKNHNESLNVNDTIAKSEAFITKYKKQIIAGAVALVIIVGGFFAFKYAYQKPREEKAQAFIAQGQMYALQGDYAKALNGDGKFPGFVKVANDYSFTDGGNIAKAWAGFCFAHSGKIKEAIKYLEDFSPANDHSLSPRAVAALADCYASDNQIDKAIKSFKKAADLADNDAISPTCLLEAGKLLESQKKNDEALKLYQQIKNDYPTSALASPQPTQSNTIGSAEIDRYIERVSK